VEGTSPVGGGFGGEWSRGAGSHAGVRQFVVFPLVLAMGGVLVFGLVWWMTHDPRTPEDLITVTRNAGGRERWQAAYEFARRVGADPALLSDPGLGRQALSLFTAVWEDDPRVAAYLARVLALTAPEGAEATLVEALASNDGALRIQVALALAEVGGLRSVHALSPLLSDEDGGVRKAAVFALGRLGDDRAVQLLVPLLRDDEVDVRWNAALGLAALGSDFGARVLRDMLDRSYLNEVSARQRAEGGRGMTDREVSEVVINAIRAATRLDRPELEEAIERLRDGDENPRVQEAARIAIDRINQE
jgi:HEAT repeat protein